MATLLNEKAKIRQSIKALKEKYKSIPAELEKLVAMEKRLTNEISAPLIAKKVLQDGNKLKVPTNMQQYETAKSTIERVEASLVIIQEKMRYWSLSRSNGGR